ncbi:hypothetical protein [Pseudooceanicola sp. MF1-13]|uniref:hypothetical protein n=1 Tax=Pseudooceanicola sp. MF1-13 TaxID=3379095 RepID=UPI003891DC90
MSLKTRLSAAERKTGQDREPDIVIFQTVYEAKDGSAESSHCRATVFFGPGQSTFLESQPNEDPEDFRCRVRTIARPNNEAQMETAQ